MRLFFYLEVPCKALFFSWTLLVRPSFLFGGPFCKGLLFTWRLLVRLFLLLGDNDDGDYVGVGAVVHTFFFYLEAPCKAIFILGGPL